MPGQFGFELDLNKCTQEELETAKEAVRKCRELQDVFHKGDCYRLISPFESDMSVMEFISEDKETVAVCINSVKATAYAPDCYIKLEGLEDGTYIINGVLYDAGYLMNQGVLLSNDKEYKSNIIILKKA